MILMGDYFATEADTVVNIACEDNLYKDKFWEFTCTFNSQGHNFYKLKYISLEEVKSVPFQQ